jgi:hypothetical protein
MDLINNIDRYYCYCCSELLSIRLKCNICDIQSLCTNCCFEIEDKCCIKEDDFINDLYYDNVICLYCYYKINKNIKMKTLFKNTNKLRENDEEKIKLKKENNKLKTMLISSKCNFDVLMKIKDFLYKN